MDLDLSHGALDALKHQAKTLRQERSARGTPTTHSEALELVAQRHGLRDWNTLRAQAVRPVRLSAGIKVQGRYLGQPFTGHVHGVQLMGKGQALRVTVHFDTPVDVVQFDSFSSFRQRVTAVVGKDGRSMSHTSDGTPHLVLETVTG